MRQILSVSEVNKYIKDTISRDIILSDLWVRGEISNYKNHYSGHLYFTLKDDKGLIKSVMFKTQASKLVFKPENGMTVIIRGYISVFERDGQYQLYAEEMQPDGIGGLHIAFEQLKKKLQNEGLFDVSRKKKLPYLPGRIGVITSITGSVIKDIMNVLGRRFSNLEIKIYPVQVQGEAAAPQIARAIKKLNETDCVDVIIIARGGGSLEDLWPFNEEIVARSIAESNLPIISAVGHETDFTISDFVSDVRAPTPSAAAELIVPEKIMLKSRLDELKNRLINSVYNFLAHKKSKLEKINSSTAFKQPFNRVYQERLKIDVTLKYLMKALEANNERVRSKMLLLIEKLDALSPLGVLARGYSIVKVKESNKILRTINNVKNGDELRISVSDGDIDCIVDKVYKEDRHG